MVLLRHSTVERRYYAHLAKLPFTGVLFYLPDEAWKRTEPSAIDRPSWPKSTRLSDGDSVVVEADFFPLHREGKIVSRITRWSELSSGVGMCKVKICPLAIPHNLEMFRSHVSSLLSLPSTPGKVSLLRPTSPAYEGVSRCIEAFEREAKVWKDTSFMGIGTAFVDGVEYTSSETRTTSIEEHRERLHRLAIEAMDEKLDCDFRASNAPKSMLESVDHLISRMEAIGRAIEDGDIPFVDFGAISREVASIGHYFGRSFDPPFLRGSCSAVISSDSEEKIPLVLCTGRKIVITSRKPVVEGLTVEEMREILRALDVIVGDDRFDEVRSEITRRLASRAF